MAILNKNIRQMIFRKIERTMYRTIWIATSSSGAIDHTDGIRPENPNNAGATKEEEDYDGHHKWKAIVEEVVMGERDIVVDNGWRFHPFSNWRHIRLNNREDALKYIKLEKEIRELDKRTKALRDAQTGLVDYSVNYNSVPYKYKKTD